MTCALAILMTIGQLARTVYVSPTGNDSASGAVASPVQSIEAALNLARTSGASGTPANIVLTKGTFPVSKTIAIGQDLSGVNISGGGNATLFAGLPLVHWQPVTDSTVLQRLSSNAQKSVLVADLPGPIDDNIDGVDLVFDGKPMQLARYPNTGWILTTTANGQTFGYGASQLTKWKDPTTLWIQGFLNVDWSDSLIQATVDQDSQSVTLSKPVTYGIKAERRFRFLNILEELDSPGEFFVDRKALKVYFWPPAPINGSTYLTSPNLSTILAVQNSNGLKIDGVKFEGGRHSAITVAGSTGVMISHCDFENFGGVAINIEDSTSSSVSACTVQHIGSEGVILKGGDKVALSNGKLSITDSHISDYARWHMCYHPGIRLDGNSNSASHNLIENAPHQAIYVAGSEMIIEYNDIKSVCLETGDSAAVYQGRDWLGEGEKIQYNRFTDISRRVSSPGNDDDISCVYLDDLWSGAFVYGNIFDCSAMGVLLGGGRDNTIQNNVFIGSNPGIWVDARGKSPSTHAKAQRGGPWNMAGKVSDALNANPALATKYPRLQVMVNSPDPLGPEGNHILTNIFLGTGQWLKLLNKVTESEIGASNNATGNGSSLSDAQNIAPTGFKNIDESQIGPRH